jgi:hypothetical protein
MRVVTAAAESVRPPEMKSRRYRVTRNVPNEPPGQARANGPSGVGSIWMSAGHLAITRNQRWANHWI